MPARFVKSYQSPTGQIFPSLAEAQADEILLLLTSEGLIGTATEAAPVAKFLVANRDKVLSCLKQKERVNLRDPKAKKAKKATPATT